MKQTILMLFCLTAIAASATNLPANGCQIYIEKLQAAPSSHNSASIQVVVKVPYLGNDETITQVKFYGYQTVQDLGNQGMCGGKPTSDTSFRLIDSVPTQYAQTQLGEYQFTFAVNSGSVISECPGYHYSTTGSFMVETNKATYWLNPSMDSNQYFVFDYQAYGILQATGSVYNYIYTNRNDKMSNYYNPRSCH
jgi:hypothetical protein